MRHPNDAFEQLEQVNANSPKKHRQVEGLPTNRGSIVQRVSVVTSPRLSGICKTTTDLQQYNCQYCACQSHTQSVPVQAASSRTVREARLCRRTLTSSVRDVRIRGGTKTGTRRTGSLSWVTNFSVFAGAAVSV